ncbi:MAG TPA: ABC transporter ATP-binding protein, partial [Spirochaetia bacterium]|nr:ABC transporter ATP-binding protein [Spirochaetia bacterium]
MDTPQEHRPGPLSRFFALLGRARPPYAALAVALAFSVAATLVGLVIPLFLKGMVDGFSLSSLGVRQIVLIALAFAGQAVGSAASGYLLTYAGQRTVANLRDLLWRKQLRLSVPFFDGHASGELVSRMNNDTAVLKTLVAENVSGFITGIISVIGAVAILLAMDWRMTAVMLGALPVTALVMVPLGRVMRRVSKGTMDQTARFTEVLSRVLSEIRLVKSSNAEDREYRRGRGAIDALLALGLREGRVQSVISPIMSFVMMGLLVAIIGYGGVRIASGAMSAGELVAFILYLIQIVMPITMITTFFTQLQKARGATESITALLDEPEETERGLPVPPGRHTLEVSEVGFGYASSAPVLKGISFSLAPGTVTALVGPSGAGKTTVFSLLERFYTPTAGAIRLDGAPIDRFSLLDWRRSIGYVPQESPLLSGTIQENLRYGVDRAVPRDELEQAARDANAHEFISALPNGYETDVGERGVKLSGGQRQRIAIAQALLRNPSLLLLDEAT